jgi:hypothetical protein
MLHKGYDRKCSIKEKSDHEREGAWRQNELIGGNSDNDGFQVLTAAIIKCSIGI